MFAWLKEIQVFTGIFREIYIKLYHVALQGIWNKKFHITSWIQLVLSCSLGLRWRLWDLVWCLFKECFNRVIISFHKRCVMEWRQCSSEGRSMLVVSECGIILTSISLPYVPAYRHFVDTFNTCVSWVLGDIGEVISHKINDGMPRCQTS